MYIQWKAIDQSLPEASRGRIGNFSVLVNNPDQSPQIAKTIDALFDSSANETMTESEQSFLLGFVTGSQVIIDALEAVSFVLLFIMLLILGNTLAMAVRERTGELAVLRTLGSGRGQLLVLSLVEGVWLSLFGGIVGALLARPVVAGFVRWRAASPQRARGSLDAPGAGDRDRRRAARGGAPGHPGGPRGHRLRAAEGE